ncbi:laccase-4-like [Bombus pyrosoma]|uniref:laccase-4-like n=1 Tax=Bombus pyrosoma TaxID=396416 RepID=UPI001CB897D2|nr:laccase-4-like [Bombus pyrosoma]
MNLLRGTSLLFVLILTALVHNAVSHSIIAGYAPGVSGMGFVNENNCLTDELIADYSLSNAAECARTCRPGESKTCYYKFVIERYPVNGQACNLCMPNATNTLCPNCQCVPGDGTQRMALTVNRMIPGPTIQVCKGDYIVVDVQNLLKSDSVTVHWHGIFQHGSPHYDGVPHLTQCPIMIHNTFRYQFFANNWGTHLWHAHTATQKLDGVFGSFIVRSPPQDEPHQNLYDFDLANHVIVINDWFKEEATSRFPGRRAGVVHQNADAFLINGKGRYIDPSSATSNIPFEVITVDANQRYRFRLINSFCTVCPTQLTIEGHSLTVITSDGQPMQPVVVDSIVSLAGERYDFVINTNQTPGAYWIQLRGLDDCAYNRIQQLALLQYEGASITPKTKEPTFDNPIPNGLVLDIASSVCSSTLNYICGNGLNNALSIDPDILKKEPDVKLHLSIAMQSYKPEEVFVPNTYKNFLVPSPKWIVATTINNISSTGPSSPPLTQLEDTPADAFCNSENLPPHCRPGALCTCIHLIKIPLNSIVEIILIDEFDTVSVRHPFHLHGYVFYVMGLGQPLGATTSSNTTNKMTLEYFKELEKKNQIERNFVSPQAKDDIPVPNNGYAIIRFRANNPGYWLLHCHQIFHHLAGMEVTLQVGEVSDMPKPPENFPRCGNFKPKIQSFTK